MKRIALVAALVLTTPASAGQTSGWPRALVTAELRNELIKVELRTGKIEKRVSLPADPQNLAIRNGTVVVVSSRAGAVTLLDEASLRIRRVLRGFHDPHIVIPGPRNGLVYVTDDGRGELVVIDLRAQRIVDRVFVGAGAHHMTLAPDKRRLWIALGERATEIAIVDASRAARPRLLRRFSPGFIVHDVAADPCLGRVWLTSGVGESVHVLNARTGTEVFAARVGRAPQHVVFPGVCTGFVTSGYSSRIVKVDGSTGRVVASARTPYGSFNLSASGMLIVTTSLLNGQMSAFNLNLRRLKTVQAAGAARAVALTPW